MQQGSESRNDGLALGLLSVLQAPGGGRGPRSLHFLVTWVRHPVLFAHSLSRRRWSVRTIIGLVMQSLDNFGTGSGKKVRRGKAKLTSRQGHGAPSPTSISAAEQAGRLLGREINGFPGSSVGEIFDIPLAAIFIGGCPIGDSPDTGVIDPYHRLYGHPGISVVDGSVVCANVGVNPALTVTAQAERAMSLWRNKGEADLRPAQGEPYRSIPAGQTDSSRCARGRLRGLPPSVPACTYHPAGGGRRPER
ncbi:GMC oxidoreductase [Micromonospora chaiyaphumensis]|uniref:Cholesterol oxidase n=1 Tax=Micromonospora chaiyaphumensis TaxID=307119 RepID=A0A1C4W4V1_9ACTN|nr:GMC oxidoreductase [Micromonospora chaiyaphumensis]SCE91215.1 GMC oxidoreductase [Micromonospora chaiyaphumensis]